MTAQSGKIPSAMALIGAVNPTKVSDEQKDPSFNACGKAYPQDKFVTHDTKSKPIPKPLEPIAKSASSIQLFKKAERIARWDDPVLITGETGTGKEVVAKFIYQYSNRRGGPFLAVNCSALPGSLFESEMFGHKKGAFTGANTDQIGLVEIARNGVLFLDEIGDLPMPDQAKILRLLENKEYRPIGSQKIQVSNARIIAATNKDLKTMVADGAFREDLFYRLNVLSLKVLPLRERREEIPEFLKYYTREICSGKNIQVKEWDGAVVSRLLEYQWPGNIRELIGLVRIMLVMVKEDKIESKHVIEFGSEELASYFSGSPSTRPDKLSDLPPLEFWNQYKGKFKGKGKDMARAFKCSEQLVTYYKKKHSKYKPS